MVQGAGNYNQRETGTGGSLAAMAKEEDYHTLGNNHNTTPTT